MNSLHAGVGLAPFNIPGFEQTSDGTPLVARCLVLDDGNVRLMIVSGTYIELQSPEANLVRQTVAEATGLADGSILLAGTHVHSGPPTLTEDPALRRLYAEHIAAAAAEAGRAALALRPARIGWATDHLPGVSRVRRIRRRDGSIITLRRAWPQYWGWASDPETVGPEEPLDDLLTVLRIEDLQGQPLAAIMQFATHPIPDFFGYAARLVERNVPGLTCLILNGCFGSVDTPFEVPMRGKTQADQLPILGDILGYRALELLARAETTQDAPLGITSRPVFLPIDERFRENPMSEGEMFAESVARGGFESEVQCLRIGDLAVVGIPGEPQVGFSRELERVSPFGLTRGVGNANGTYAYLLTEEARARGGYEADPAYWGIVTGQGLVNVLAAARDCLAELHGG